MNDYFHGQRHPLLGHHTVRHREVCRPACYWIVAIVLGAFLPTIVAWVVVLLLKEQTIALNVPPGARIVPVPVRTQIKRLTPKRNVSDASFLFEHHRAFFADRAGEPVCDLGEQPRQGYFEPHVIVGNVDHPAALWPRALMLKARRSPVQVSSCMVKNAE